MPSHAELEALVRSSLGAVDVAATQVEVGGKTFDAAKLDSVEVDILANDLVVIAAAERNAAAAGILARGAGAIAKAVKMVKKNSTQDYRGGGARGHELVVNPIRVGDMIDSSGNSLTTWYRSVTSATSRALWGSSSNTRSMLVSSLPVLSHVLLGLSDPVVAPTLDTVQLVRDGDPWPEEVLNFGWQEGVNGQVEHIHELKTAWIIPPGHNYYIPVRDYRTGDDQVRPIGVTVKRASDILSALA